MVVNGNLLKNQQIIIKIIIKIISKIINNNSNSNKIIIKKNFNLEDILKIIMKIYKDK